MVIPYQYVPGKNTCGYCNSTSGSGLLKCTCKEDCGNCCPAADDMTGRSHP